MDQDELEIRNLVGTWMQATQEGDTATVLQLMSEDVVFLQPGAAPMFKPEFALAMQQHAGKVRIEPQQVIRDLQISGDTAYMWSELDLKIFPNGADQPVLRAGHTLSVFRKHNGRWQLIRDANLLVTRSAQ